VELEGDNKHKRRLGKVVCFVKRSLAQILSSLLPTPFHHIFRDLSLRFVTPYTLPMRYSNAYHETPDRHSFKFVIPAYFPGA